MDNRNYYAYWSGNAAFVCSSWNNYTTTATSVSVDPLFVQSTQALSSTPYSYTNAVSNSSTYHYFNPFTYYCYNLSPTTTTPKSTGKTDSYGFAFTDLYNSRVLINDNICIFFDSNRYCVCTC